MRIEIITPEKKMFEGEADAVQFPGIEGFFQVLKGHAPIVSALKEGSIKINLTEGNKDYNQYSGSFQVDDADSKVIYLTIKGGVVELQNDKIIVLAD